jgi:hypothetical protein
MLNPRIENSRTIGAILNLNASAVIVGLKSALLLYFARRINQKGLAAGV